MIRRLATILILQLVVLQPWTASAQESAQPEVTLMISQVQISGPAGSDDEFIEIKNVSAQEIDLSGWSVQYRSASSGFPVSSKRNLPAVTVPPGKYFLIARSAYSGTVPADLIQSSFSLSGAASGAGIYLSKTTELIVSNEDPNIADYLFYGDGHGDIASAPLAESGKSIKVSLIDAKSYLVSDSQPRNLLYEELSAEPEQENEPADADEDKQQEQGDDQENEPEDDQNEQEEDIVEYSSAIKITEFLPNPTGSDSGKEWVELQNTSLIAVSLKGWLLDDEGPEGSGPGSSAYKLADSAVISAGGYLKINIPAGKFTLNNTTADAVRLFSPDEMLKDSRAHSGSAKENQTWCLLGNIFAWCKPTPEQANAPLEIPELEEEEEVELIDYSKYEIRIIGLLPNPVGADSGSEAVILFNQGAESVNLKNWILDDGLLGDAIGSTAYVLPENILDVGEELELILPKGKMSLNNTGEEGVRLFSPDKQIRDLVNFEKAPEGIMFSKVSGQWQWLEESAEEAGTAASGEVAAANTKESKLPATGLKFNWFLFVILAAICYIICGFSNNKGTYEQTRSH